MKQKIILFLSYCFFFLLETHAQQYQKAVISSQQLSVTVAKDFPLIYDYQLQNKQNKFLGSVTNSKQILVNGSSFPLTVSSVITTSAIHYKINIDAIDVILQLQIKVIKNTVDFKIINIEERGIFRVHTIQFPHHELLSISSRFPKAYFAGAKMFTAVKGNKGDVFEHLTKKSALNTLPKGFLYGILNTKQLAATIWTNAVEEKTDKNRILKQTFKKGKTTYTSIWSGSWIYRANRIKTPSDLPHLKIILTSDLNEDQLISWQDGAIAFRDIMNKPFGSESVKNWVVYRIPMNFASQATNPFLKTLDETKRIFLHTDGLGQFVIHKGYAGEGHDSNHPDFGYIGKRQGGAKDLNFLCNQALQYNTSIGVHINATESYPEARCFNEQLVFKNKKGWNWLDQSYYIDKRYDAIENKRLHRLQSLKSQVPNLRFIYLDVWYGKGSWDSRKIAKEINAQNWILTTEFPQDLEYNAVWNHWAVDYQYGGKNIKGFHSKIARFIRNHQKDTWIAKHPLLGGAEMVDFEGWQGRINYNQCIDVTFRVNLPTKYLQHFPILKWEKNAISFEQNVVATLHHQKRKIYKNNALILNDDTYLLPWNPYKETKLYHWNEKGGITTWQLPNSWKKIASVFLYQLSDTGKLAEKELKVINGNITINALAKTPYVIFKTPQISKTMVWGEGTLIKNGGFNSGNLSSWQVKGNNVQVHRNSLGQYELKMKEAGSISQKISQLPKGSYCAEVYVQTSKNRKASLQINTSTQTFSNYTQASLWKNYIGADSKHGTAMQRMYVFFNITQYHDDVLLTLKGEKGKDTITFDDVRLYPFIKEKTKDSLYFLENFEQIPNGIYPFIKGPAGGANDPRIHLSEKHSPFTQKGWNDKKVDDVLSGNWSLKLHENALGLLVQTIPQNLRFKAGNQYKITFDYQAEADNAYSFVLGDEQTVVFEIKINKQTNTHQFEFVFTASATGNSWFGFKKNTKKTSDLIIDNVKIFSLNKK